MAGADDRRRSARGGAEPPAKPATYGLVGDTGRLAMQGSGATLDVLTFADVMCKRTYESIESLSSLIAEDRAAIAQHWHDLDAAMKLLKSSADERMRRAADILLGSCLALGFYHPGNPDLVKQAQAEARKGTTEKARAIASALQVNKEGAQAHLEVRRLCFSLWKSRPEILKIHPWVRETARQIHLDIVEAMKPHISDGSKWSADALERSLDILKNPIGKAGAEIGCDPDRIP